MSKWNLGSFTLGFAGGVGFTMFFKPQTQEDTLRKEGEKRGYQAQLASQTAKETHNDLDSFLNVMHNKPVQPPPGSPHKPSTPINWRPGQN